MVEAMLKVWRHTMHISLKNSPAEFHPDPIWNDCFFEQRVAPQQEQAQKQDEWRHGIIPWSKSQARS